MDLPFISPLRDFKKHRKSLLPSLFFTLSFLSIPIFWTLAHRQIIQAFSDLGKKAEREERDTLTGFPFVRLIVWGRRRERVQGKGTGYKMGVPAVGAAACNGCCSE